MQREYESKKVWTYLKDQPEDELMHVVPIVLTHQLSRECWCQPEWKEGLWVHNDVN